MILQNTIKEKIQQKQTPFYLYDSQILANTLKEIKTCINGHPEMMVHYAIKANSNPAIIKRIADEGFGLDCVSGGEIEAGIKAGVPANKIVYAGVGKSDKEIRRALELGIYCFNVESEPELEVINELAAEMHTIAPIALRINPNIDAHTHANITTGKEENKFGIPLSETLRIIRRIEIMGHVHYLGLHFHIGSQILDFDPFALLCQTINKLLDELESNGIQTPCINVGGGLGVDYIDPDKHPIPDFKSYFDTFINNLKLREGQTLHFELGRSIVAQCGNLITKVLYVKPTHSKQFLIVDAGFTDLVRPALYQAYHKIENIDSTEKDETYDVVGPICESSDVFVTDYKLPRSRRGDILAIRSAGAYGEVMASTYNCRSLIQGYMDDEL